jgi:hypothetical protein
MNGSFKLKLCVRLSLLALNVFLISLTFAKAQCSPEEYSLECIQRIREGFIYLKSFNIDGNKDSKSRVEYTTVFSRDTQYVLYICTGLSDSDGIILTIYNPQREIMATNHTGDNINSELEFNCTRTGIYYLTFTFQSSESMCGGCVLSFRK